MLHDQNSIGTYSLYTVLSLMWILCKYLLHTLHHILRTLDGNIVFQAKDPTIKLSAGDNGDGGSEVLVVHFAELDSLTKFVEHCANHPIVEEHCHPFNLTTEHTKGLLGVFLQIDLFKGFLTKSIGIQLIDVLVKKPRNGYSPKPVSYETPYKSMTLSATTSGVFMPEYFKYIDEEIAPDSHLWLKPGDILVQRANSLEKVGTNAIYTGREREFIYPDLMMKLQLTERAVPEFIAYQLKIEQVMTYFRSNATGTAGNMPKINQKTVSETPIVLPSLPEQREIVRILDSLLSKEQQAHDAALAVIDRIDAMKKAVLAKAFRGELGTNVAEEEAISLD